MIVGRPNTERVKRSLLNNWVMPYLKQDGSNLDAAVAVWENNLQPNSVKSVLYVAKEYVKDVSSKDLDIQRHIHRIGRSKQEKDIVALTKDEVKALVGACSPSDRIYLPMMISLHTGFRRGEIWGLNWGDIDFIKGQITVSRSYDGPTKSGRIRIVPIGKTLERILVAEMKINSYNYEKDRVITKTFDPNPLLRAACKKAGVRENLTFHALRHTFATLALESGVSPRLLSKQLGHASTSTTLNIYWSCTNEFISTEFLDEK